MCSVESCFADVESYPLMEMPPRAQHAYYIFAVAQAAVRTLLVGWEYDQPGDRYLWLATASSSTLESKARRLLPGADQQPQGERRESEHQAVDG